MTPEELAVIEAGAETALDAVHRGWPWPEIDNDLIIGAALKDVPALVAEVKRLQSLNRAVLYLLDQHHATDYTRLPPGATCPICSKHPQTLKAAAP